MMKPEIANELFSIGNEFLLFCCHCGVKVIEGYNKSMATNRQFVERYKDFSQQVTFIF